MPRPKSVKDSDKYREKAYRSAKLDTSHIKLNVGSELYYNDKLYGTIIKETDTFYYLQKNEQCEPNEFIKENLREKIANGILELK